MNTYSTDLPARKVRTGDRLRHHKARWDGWTVIGISEPLGQLAFQVRDLTPAKDLPEGTAVHRTHTVIRSPEEKVTVTREDRSLVLHYTVVSEYGPEGARIQLVRRDGSITTDGQAILDLVARHR